MYVYVCGARYFDQDNQFPIPNDFIGSKIPLNETQLSHPLVQIQIIMFVYPPFESHTVKIKKPIIGIVFRAYFSMYKISRSDKELWYEDLNTNHIELF